MSSLKDVFFKWVLQYVFGCTNYSIRSVDMTYEVVDKSKEMITFWKNQHLEEGTIKTVNVRGSLWRPIPKCVRIHAIIVRYWYNGKIYTYIPQSSEDTMWPPKKTIQFYMPIKNAFLLDENDKIIMDVTNVIKMIAGPRSDLSFFNRIKKLCITHIIGQSSVFVAK